MTLDNEKHYEYKNHGHKLTNSVCTIVSFEVHRVYWLIQLDYGRAKLSFDFVSNGDYFSIFYSLKSDITLSSSELKNLEYLEIPTDPIISSLFWDYVRRTDNIGKLVQQIFGNLPKYCIQPQNHRLGRWIKSHFLWPTIEFENPEETSCAIIEDLTKQSKLTPALVRYWRTQLYRIGLTQNFAVLNKICAAVFEKLEGQLDPKYLKLLFFPLDLEEQIDDYTISIYGNPANWVLFCYAYKAGDVISHHFLVKNLLSTKPSRNHHYDDNKEPEILLNKLIADEWLQFLKPPSNALT